jgi:hypothetical protein
MSRLFNECEANQAPRFTMSSRWSNQLEPDTVLRQRRPNTALKWQEGEEHTETASTHPF